MGRQVQGEHLTFLDPEQCQIPDKFRAKLPGTTMVVQSDNATVVAYVYKEGDRVCLSLTVVVGLAQWCGPATSY